MTLYQFRSIEQPHKMYTVTGDSVADAKDRVLKEYPETRRNELFPVKWFTIDMPTTEDHYGLVFPTSEDKQC